MKNLVLVLTLLGSPAWAQSVYQSQPYDEPVAMAADFSPPYWSNLEAVYTFNDPADLGADSSGNGNSLTPNNTPTATGGAKGFAASFTSASSQYATLTSELFSPDEGVSWGAFGWFRTSSSDTIFSKSTSSTTEGNWRIFTSGTDDLACYLKADIVASQPTVTYFPGERGFFHCRYNETGNAHEMGINDDERSPFSGSGYSDGAPTPTAPVNISGYADGTDLYTGIVGPVGFYRSAAGGDVFTNALVASLHNSGKGKRCEDLTADETVNLVECWTMDDDPSGGAYVGSQGSGDLTPQNSPARARGLVELPDSGMSVELDGVNQTLSTSAAAFAFTSDFSICGWFFSDTTAAPQYPVSKFDQSPDFDGYYFLSTTTTGNVSFVVDQDSAACPAIVNPTTEWHHFCGTVDVTAGELRCYLEGVGGTPATSNSVTAATEPLYIGAIGILEFDGAIDEVKLWSRNIGEVGVGEDYADGVGKFH